ncbi:MAG: phosphatase PAP2 family protein [Mucilaginibacter sp.]
MKITPQRKRILAYIVIGFVLLTILVSLFPPTLIDREFSEEIQEHQNPLLNLVMKAVSYPGYMPYAAVMVLATVLVFYVKKRKREALFLLLTTGSSLISTIVKFMVNRPRPSKNFVKVIIATHQQSFPSGHVFFYVVFFGFLALLMYMLKHINNTLRLLVVIGCMLMIFIIPVSRVYLGAHWFTDVLGGFLLGILYLFALSYWYLKGQRN